MILNEFLVWPETGDPDWPTYATEHGWTDLALSAVAVVNGKAVATEDAWRAFQLANGANDRNGTYNVDSIFVTPKGMRYTWDFYGDPADENTSYDIVFPRVEANSPDGSPLYLFDGPWVLS